MRLEKVKSILQGGKNPLGTGQVKWDRNFCHLHVSFYFLLSCMLHDSNYWHKPQDYRTFFFPYHSYLCIFLSYHQDVNIAIYFISAVCKNKKKLMCCLNRQMPSFFFLEIGCGGYFNLRLISSLKEGKLVQHSTFFLETWIP